MDIRPISPDDEVSVVEILNCAIKEHRNAYLEEMNAEQGGRWFLKLLQESYATLVAEREGRCLGWGVLGPYRQGRGGLRLVSEISFYVHPESRAVGVGRSLASALEDQARTMGMTHLIAILLDNNTISKHLLLSRGYQILGHFPNLVAFEEGTAGHLYMGKELVRSDFGVRQ